MKALKKFLQVFFLFFLLVFFNKFVFNIGSLKATTNHTINNTTNNIKIPKTSLKLSHKVLIFSISYINLEKKDIANVYLKTLKEKAKEKDIEITIKSLPKKSAIELLEKNQVSLVSEIKFVEFEKKTNIEWKIFKKQKETSIYPVHFNVTLSETPSEKNFFQESLENAVRKTVNFLLSLVTDKIFITKIEVSGNLDVGRDFILSLIKLNPGDLLDIKKVNESLKAIYETGYFENVEVCLEKHDNEGVLIFKVTERPVLKDIKFEGNKAVKDGTLSNLLQLKKGEIVTPDLIERSVSKILDYYKAKGFEGTKVEVSQKEVSPREVELVFHIKEGKKLYIKKITFVGNKAFSEKKLKSLMVLKEKTSFMFVKKIFHYVRNFFSLTPKPVPGVYSEIFLEYDLNQIELFYKNNGYLDVKVGDPLIVKKEGEVTITIPIEEGPCYKVRNIEIEQDLFSKEYIEKKLSLKPGDTFSLKKLNQDRVMITNLFVNKGYAYAKVNIDFKKDPKKGIIDIKYSVHKGPIVYINRIEITGNLKTRDKVIRRQVLIAEKWRYNKSKIEKSKQKIRRLGYFKNVEIYQEKAPKEDEINLKIKVEEIPTGSFSIGGGYSSRDRFYGMMELSDNNFLGKGQKLGLSFRISGKETSYSINFFEPYFRDSLFSFSSALYKRKRRYSDFTKEIMGGRVKWGRHFSPDLYGYLGYKIENVNLTDIAETASPIILESKDLKLTSAIIGGLKYDTRDDFFLPKKGWNNRLNFVGAGLGGDTKYIKLTTTDELFFPIIWKITGHIKVGGGYITEGPDWKLPVFERFYLGGIDSVRCFEYGDISVIDPKTKEKIGGTRMAYIQVEKIIPLVESIKLAGVVFFDMGTVWDRNNPFKFSEVKKGVGWGIRWFSPLGPIRLEWGYNIDRKEGEPKSNFNFEIGGWF